MAHGQQVILVDLHVHFAKKYVGDVRPVDDALFVGRVEPGRKEAGERRVYAVWLARLAVVPLIGKEEKGFVLFNRAADVAAELVVSTVFGWQVRCDGIGILTRKPLIPKK